MRRKLPFNLKRAIYLLCFIGYSIIAPLNAQSAAFILDEEQTNVRLQPYVQILEEGDRPYTIEEIVQPTLQAKFQDFPEHTLKLANYKYYWGKIQLDNRLKDTDRYSDWVLTFSHTWTKLTVFTEDKNGHWVKDQNGTFTPEHAKRFAPAARDNLVKFNLPPDKTTTIYFRGISERTAITPSFYLRLRDLTSFYDELLKTKVSNALFMGFLLMMFLYNLFVYLFGRDRSFLFYSGYLIMMVFYSGYLSDDLADWLGPYLFPDHPQYLFFFKQAIYLGLMCYLAFIRSFLDLKQLLPRWDTFFKIVIYLGFPLILLDLSILYVTNFSYAVEDKVTVTYIVLSILACFSLLFPLFKTKDRKGYFVIAGISALILGALISVFTLVYDNIPFTSIYLKIGTIIEILFFSLGLAYRQRQQNIEKQQADFKLKESELIQEKKALEANRLQELNDFKTRFYTNITHEFRTPLTVIMGMSEHLKNNPKEQELIQRNSKSLLRLINQLLDLSKLESGVLALNKVHQDIIIYLQYLTESFYSAANQKQVRLVFYSEAQAVWMDYDEEKIQQIVYNLLSNALKFTQQHGRVVFHASKMIQDGQSFLKLKIKDTGVGIPATNISAIFDRFYQVNQTSESQAGGTGIGLALTKELIELMKGRIEVSSTVGVGTEFRVYLPIESQVQPKQAIDQKIVKSKEPHQLATTNQALESKEKNVQVAIPYFSELLIIEDNPDIVTFITSILQHKYNVHTANNGALGIEKAEELIPDIIISDVMMPEKNGYEVCETLKQNERTSHIPIILLTAKATQKDKVAGLEYGADAYLTKPFDKAELLVRLEKLVAIRKQLQLQYANTATIKADANPIISKEDIFLNKLKEQLQSHLNDAEFGVGELAKSTLMSQMQLYRKLKALTGKTPSQFIRSYRLQKGLELLQSGQLNVSEVAYEVGFTDPSYFTRVFQKEFGRNPSAMITQ